MSSPSQLNQLMQSTGMWRASHLEDSHQPGTPTGFDELDRQLAGGGWPTDGLTELLHNTVGIGEMSLLGPALAYLSQHETRWIVLVAPPFIPYAPGLAAMGIDLRNVLVVRPREHKDVLWVIEQALASSSCSAVLSWERKLDPRDLRRLNLAGREGQTWGVLFRPAHAARDASSAELRLLLTGQQQTDHAPHREVEVQILKRRGGCATDAFRVNLLDSLEPSPVSPPAELSGGYCNLPFQSPTGEQQSPKLTLIETDGADVMAGLERSVRKEAARDR